MEAATKGGSMSIRDLPTLAEMQAQRRATPKHALVTRLEQKADKQKADTKAMLAFRAAVFKRDGGKCRICHKKVVRTLALVANRAEAHHKRGRRVAPEDRYNVATALLTCAKCHQAIHMGRIEVPK
jgi:predicted HNH restriction endonuclease